MSNRIYSTTLIRILILLMVLTGKFPTWAYAIIIAILVIQFIDITIRLVRKYKDKP